MTDQPVDPETTDAPPSHPEEMKGTVEINFGRLATMTATGRTTPAGLIGAALLVSSVLIPLVIMTRRRR
ncbi:MAG TPA: hypothetical protein VFG62_03580 [Rhodopila sp.]|jgi:hypothetical protein|nr:hypothetical protein [Rhodopila sp.]